MKTQTLKISSTNQNSLNATLYLASDTEFSSNLIILCHGFTGDQYEWKRFPKAAEKFVEEGFTALTFDFSGSGKNRRIPITIKQQVEDLESVFKWAQNQGYQKISVIGLSFGGLTALLAKIPERKTTVFWAPAFFMRRIIGLKIILMRIIALFRKKPIQVDTPNNEPLLLDKTFLDTIYGIDINKTLQNFTESCLIIQGDRDRDAKLKYTQKAYELMPNKEIKKLVIVPGADHNFKGEHLEQFIEHSIKWIKDLHNT